MKKILFSSLAIFLLLFNPYAAEAQLSFEEFDQLKKLSSPFSLKAADFDNDGLKDLAFSSESDKVVSIAFNLGNQTYGQPLVISLDTNETNENASHEKPITFGDFNEDGFTDLVILNHHPIDSAGVSILFFGANRQIDTLISLSTGGAYASDILTSDFDKDGHLDFAVAHGDGNFTLLKGDGLGAFKLQHQISFESEPRSISLSDLNNDGWNDLVVVLPFAKKIVSLLGNEDGSFTQHSSFPVADNPGKAYTGDLNLDGIQDLLVIHPYSQLVRHQGLGDGSFDAGTTVAVPENYQVGKSAALADIDKDGRVDIISNASWGYDKLVIFKNRGNMVFEADLYPVETAGLPNSFVVEDLDEDGALDIAYSSTASGSVSIHSGGGTSPFLEQHHIYSGLAPWSVKAGDINNDTWSDLVVANTFSNSISIYLNEGGKLKEYKTVETSYQPQKVALWDMNKDGNLDILTVGNLGDSYNNNRSVMLGDGNGNFSEPILFSYNSSSTIAINDFNNDGNPDFATIDGVYLGAGNGNFSFQYFQFANHSYGAISADFNADGNTDLAFTSLSENVLRIFSGNGAGSFTLQAEYATGQDPFGLEMADLNQDGIVDIVCANRADRTLSIFDGKEDGSFSAARSISLTSSFPSDLKIRDFDLDGILDIAVSDWDKGEVQLLTGDSEGNFTLNLALNVKGTPNQLDVADFNKDNKPDIVTANPNGNNVAYYLNNSVLEPASPPTAVSLLTIKSNSAIVSWEQDTLTSSIVLIKEETEISSTPKDGVFYAQNMTFGLGGKLEDGSYVVYAGQDTSVNIEGLKENSNYHLKVFSFNVNSQNTIANYQTSTFASELFRTLKTQTISFTAPSDPVVSDSVITINASSSSGLSVDLEVVSGPAETNENKIYLKGAGLVEILMKQIGNQEYDLADSLIAFCVRPVPPFISVYTSDSTNFTLVSSESGDLGWFYNGELIPNATTDSIIVNKTGSYSVRSSAGECYSDSEVIQLLVNGLNELWEENNPLVLFPNPVKDKLHLKFPTEIIIKRIQLYNTQGSLLIAKEGNYAGLSVRNLSAGIYYILVETNKGSILRKVYKN